MLTESQIAAWEALRKAALGAWDRKDAGVDYASTLRLAVGTMSTFTVVRAMDLAQCTQGGMLRRDAGIRWGISAGRVGQIVSRFLREDKRRHERADDWEAESARKELEDQAAGKRCPPHRNAAYLGRVDEVWGLSIRARNALRDAGITYAWELAETPLSTLSALPNVGRKTMWEFAEYLDQLRNDANART